MKFFGVLCVIVGVIMLLAPLAAVSVKSPVRENGTETESVAEETVLTSAVSSDTPGDTISVFMTDKNETEVLDMRQYIIGTVAAEMPASYEKEALKAQALAAVTFAVYRKQQGGDPDMDGADISDNSSSHQGYMSREQMEEKWGEAFDTYYAKIENAVNEVLDKIITCDGKPIMAAYHAISCGKTESAKVLWGADVPYLRSVSSEWDKESARYKTEVRFSVSELEKLLSSEKSEFTDEDRAKGVKIKDVSDSGTVLRCEIFSVDMTGAKARNLLSLRSPVFDAVYSDGEYVFTVYGYGHGIGMSQNGANCMAKEGRTYEEIIAHYYSGTEISERQK